MDAASMLTAYHSSLPPQPWSWSQLPPLHHDHQKSNKEEEEIRHLLLCACLELESTRAHANEQEQRVLQLEHLLVNTLKERDEARQLFLQLQSLLNNPPCFATLDDLYTDHMDLLSLPAPLSEPDLLHMDLIGGLDMTTLDFPTSSGVYVSPCKNAPPPYYVQKNKYLPEPAEDDIGNLPERGKLVQAVMQAGPLLQTLITSPNPR